MSEINCYIPIKLRITGRPSDSQLDQLGDALVRALTARMEFAERAIEDGHCFKAGGGSDLREPFLSARQHPELGTYTIPSYDNGGAPEHVLLQSSNTPNSMAGGALTQESGGSPQEEIIRMIRARFAATNGLPGSSGLYYGVYLTARGENTPRLYYLVPGANGPKVERLRLFYRRLDQPDAELDLSSGNYSLLLRPHGPGQLYRDSKHIADLANPENRDIAINFFVPAGPDVIEVTARAPRRFHLYPRLSVVRANDESRLMTGAETVYLADVEIWRVDDYDNWTPIWGLALIYTFISYEWKIWHINRTHEGGAEQRALVRQAKTDHPFLTQMWESDGEYEIECSITAHYEDTSPRAVTERRRDVVIALEAKMALDLAQLEKLESQPGAKGVWPKSAWALLEAALNQLREAERDPEGKQAIIDSLRKAVETLKNQIVNQTAEGPFPLRAIFTDFRTGQTRPLSLFIGPALMPEDGHAHTWKLIDLTVQGSRGPYTGNGKTAGEAIRAAFESMRTKFNSPYPPGRILASIEWPGMSKFGLSRFDFAIETESWENRAFQVGAPAMGALGVLGLAAGMVFPPTSWFVTTIVITSAVGAATLSAINIIERINTNSFEWDRETAMDLLNIAAAFTAVGGAALGRAANIARRPLDSGLPVPISQLSKLSKVIRFQRGMLYTDILANAGNALLIGYDTYLQLRDADAATGDSTLAEYIGIYGPKEGRQRWEVERVARILGVLARAAVSSGLILIAVRGSSKSLSESQKVLEELSRITNPELSWGLSMSYKQSGQTAESRQPGSVDADLPRVIINPDAAGKTPSGAEIDRAKVLEMRHPAPGAERSRLIDDQGAIEETMRLLQEGKLTLSSDGKNPRIILWRGTVHEYIRGVTLDDHDLNDGLYLTLDRGLATLYAQQRRADVQVENPGTPGIVLGIDVLPGELGKVFDFYHDKDLNADWNKFLDKSGDAGAALKLGRVNGNYNGLFKTWLYTRRIDVSQFNSISGPEYVRGGHQIVILRKESNKEIIDRLLSRAVEVERLHDPLVPGYPDDGFPITKQLWEKIKKPDLPIGKELRKKINK